MIHRDPYSKGQSSDKMKVYKDFVSIQKNSSLQKILFEDLTLCSELELQMFGYLLPDIYQQVRPYILTLYCITYVQYYLYIIIIYIYCITYTNIYIYIYIRIIVSTSSDASITQVLIPKSDNNINIYIYASILAIAGTNITHKA